jgi:hypothetical protein
MDPLLPNVRRSSFTGLAMQGTQLCLPIEHRQVIGAVTGTALRAPATAVRLATMNHWRPGNLGVTVGTAWRARLLIRHRRVLFHVHSL